MFARKNKQFKKSSFGLFGLIIICIGIIIVSHDYILAKKEAVFTKMNIKLFESETPIVATSDSYQGVEEEVSEPENPSTVTETPEQPKQKQVNYNYIGVLEIPKVNLKQGFFFVISKYNNVDYNITVIQSSTYPDVERGNLILAAHSGTSYISYFKNLYKLSVGDEAYVYYNNIKYKYEIVNIYNVEKTGQVAIYRNTNATVLTLITCTKNSDHEQTVYILELTGKENY